MRKQVLFIQGAGQGAHEADEKLVISLERALGSAYTVRYPAMQQEDDPNYETWKQQIEKEIANLPEPIIVVGHSVGGSMLIKCLSEIDVSKKIAGIFLIAAPFWGGDGWRYEGYETLALPTSVAAMLPKDPPVFLYHSRDDEIVPFEHLALYAHVLPRATTRELAGGHQLGNDLSELAADITGL